MDDFDRYLQDLATSVGSWLQDPGPEGDVAVSTRIRVARNVMDFPFGSRLEGDKAHDLNTRLRDALEHEPVDDGFTFLELDHTPRVGRQLLLERHLISSEMAGGEGERGVAFGEGELMSVMVNEEDHVRIQAMRPGFDLDGAWKDAQAVERRLGSRVPFSFHEEFGYLTACPTNVGSGIRVSVMLHLPGLALAPKELKRVFRACRDARLAIRGYRGEGSQAVGALYQFSNQTTLGRSEADLIDVLGAMVARVIGHERRVRGALMDERGPDIEERVRKAIGRLVGVEKVASNEALMLLSIVRLGVYMGLLDEPDIATLNRLLVQIQPAHLVARTGVELDADKRDVARAAMLKRVFAGG